MRQPEKPKGYMFTSRTQNFTPGYSITSQYFYPYYIRKNQSGEEYEGWNDFDTDRGRVIYNTPEKSDTVYYNYPDKFINVDNGFEPIGTTKDQEAAKQKFYQYAKQAKSENNEESRQALHRAKVNKKQQGGTMNAEQQELQYALLGYVVATKKQPKDENEINQIAQQLIQLKQQDPNKYNQLVQLGQQAQAQKAEKGAKLNYIKSLKGQCPDGEELVYFKKGGMIGCGCQKKEKGGEVKQPKKANAIEEFKKGRKTKKC